MANFIDLIYSKDAVSGAKEVLSLLEKTNDEIVKLSKKNLDLAGGASPKNPAQMKAVIDNFTKAQAASDKATAAMVKNAERQRLAELKLAQDRDKAFAKYEQQLNREQQKLAATQSLYNKTQQQLNALQSEYRELAIQKELGNKLTDKEAARYAQLQGQITRYDKALKAVDASMGKHQRNVGNYAGSFNPLSNSINQLTREMPAFANSVQTGFMAISNNLPIFFDSIGEAIRQQKALQAEGKPSKNALQLLAGSFFTLGTALSVGVTLLTLFGPKLVDMIFNTKKAADAEKAHKEAIEEKIKAEERQNEEIGQAIANEQNRARILFEIAKNEEVSVEKRNEALKELRDRYGKYLGDLSDQKILAGETAEAEERLNKALLGRGYAMAAQSLLEKNLTAQMALQVQYEKERAKFGDVLFNSQKKLKGGTDEYYKAIKNGSKAELEARNALNSKLTPLKEEERILLDLFNSNAKYLDAVDETTDKVKKQKKAKEELEQVETNSKIAFERNIAALQGQLDKMSILNPQYALLAFQLKLVKDAYEALYGEQKKQEKQEEKLIKYGTEEYYEARIKSLRAEQAAVADNTEQYALYDRIIGTVQADLDRLRGTTKEVTEETKEMDAFLKGFIDDFAGKAGFGKLIDLVNGGLEELKGDSKKIALAISDAFQEAFNTINEAQEANYQNQLGRLESQKNIAIQFAGDSAAAREEIERQYEEKRRELDRKRAEQQKKTAIFNILIDTAQAVVAALPNIPLSILVGALGAAQIAMVAAQPIPAYADGTLNHSGGAMLINDGKGSNYTETVVTPDGKMKQYKGRNVVVDAPKGTKVFNHDQWNEQLNNILKSTGIISPSLMNFGQQQNNNSVTAEEIKDMIMAGKDEFYYDIYVDENGFRKMINKNGMQREILNSRLRTKGRNV